MQLTMNGEYAIRAMIHLSGLPLGTVVPIGKISKQWNIPESFLRKISVQLARANLIISQRGLNGGIRLSHPAATITILDVIEAVEGTISLNKCLLCRNVCSRDEWCQVHLLWSEAQAKLKEILASKTLAQLAADNLCRQTELNDGRRDAAVAKNDNGSYAPCLHADQE
jgi:Rrf2 family protein